MQTVETTTFSKIMCPICNKEISKGGAAYTSHMRLHVRLKEATEVRQKKRLVFLPAKGQNGYVEPPPFALLGDEPLPGQPKEVYELPEISKFLPAIDPAAYFTTSGEAVKKADKLVKDLYSAALTAKAFRDKLIKARGEKKYLETCREDGRLLVKAKDPRKPQEQNNE